MATNIEDVMHWDSSGLAVVSSICFEVIHASDRSVLPVDQDSILKAIAEQP